MVSIVQAAKTQSIERWLHPQYVKIHVYGERSENFISNLKQKLYPRTSAASRGIIVTLDYSITEEKGSVISPYKEYSDFLSFHYKDGSAAVYGSKTTGFYGNCYSTTIIAGSEKARREVESQLIEMTGDDLQKHD